MICGYQITLKTETTSPTKVEEGKSGFSCGPSKYRQYLLLKQLLGRYLILVFI